MTTTLRFSARLLVTVSLAAALAACSSTTTPKNPSSSNPPGSQNPTNPGEPGQPPITNPPVTNTGKDIVLTNLDGEPYNDRLVFNRIQDPRWEDKNNNNAIVMLEMHDLGKLQVKNTSNKTVDITGGTFSKPVWRFDNAPSFPITLAPGETTTLQIRFTATGDRTQARDCRTNTLGATIGCFYEGTLTLNTTKSDETQKQVQLAGFWQSQPESDDREPSLQEIVDLFGYKTTLVNPGEKLNPDYKGNVRKVGDEVLSPYWLPADSSQPVKVRQLAAFHGAPQNEKLRWFPEGRSESLTEIIDHDRMDAQTVLPRNYQLKGPAAASFRPGGSFGFKVDHEWSDPALNRRDAQEKPTFRRICAEGDGDGGHNVRFWPVKNREGEIVPNTYLMAMDAFCINYDYNDNVYLVSNVKPAK